MPNGTRIAQEIPAINVRIFGISMKYDLVAAHRRCVAAVQGVRPRQATLLLAFATCILVASHPSARARGCLPADTDCPPNVSVVDKTNAAKAGKDPVVVAREDDEIAIYDDLLTRFGSATDPALREPVAKALLNKGLRLGVLGRVPEELATLDDLIARFGTATEPALREQVAKAMLNKGFRLGKLRDLQKT